jgi:hypothetical protein
MRCVPLPRSIVRARVCAALVLAPVASPAQPHVQNELNSAKTAM